MAMFSTKFVSPGNSTGVSSLESVLTTNTGPSRVPTIKSLPEGDNALAPLKTLLWSAGENVALTTGRPRRSSDQIAARVRDEDASRLPDESKFSDQIDESLASDAGGGRLHTRIVPSSAVVISE